MKKIISLILMVMIATEVLPQQRLTVREITGSTYRQQTMSAVKMLGDGLSYSALSSDGKQVKVYSLKNGQPAGVLFDADNTLRGKVEKIDGYELSPDESRMLVWTDVKMIYRRSFTARYYIYNIQTRVLEPLSDFGPQQSPVWSPDSRNIAFVRDNNIFLVRLLYDNAETQVTKDGKRNEIINGIPDWVNEEEFGFSTALTFTIDGTMLSWIRYDESQVKDYRLNDYVYKYPVAGARNSDVSVMSYDLQSRQTRKMQVPVPAEGYIPRIKMERDTDCVVVYTMNRHQDELCLYKVNTRSTVSKLMVKEKEKCYVKEEVVENILVNDGYLVMPSERSGKMQYYLYGSDGMLQRQLTNTDGEVTAFYGYDAKSGSAYYQACGRNPMEREIYVTDRKGKTTCLTPRAGWNSAIFSKDFSHFISVWSDAHTPYLYTICNQSGKQVASLIDNHELQAKLKGMNLPKKEFFKFRTSEGVELNGVMIRPADFDPAKKYPVVMWQYSGPGSQQVVNSWSLGMLHNGAIFEELLAQHGFISVCVDGRGTGGRGADFERTIYRRMGQLESKDQVEAAQYLASLPYVDKNRIGIWGWSFGGFNTLMSMSEGRDVFRAGVAVAPVTDWRFYDSVYTERYMQTPGENGAGYDDNPISRASQLNGDLLICHGTADDNVHPENTFDYSEALVEANKDFSQRLYKGRNHSIFGGNTRNHLYRQILNHFEKTLKNEK